MDKIEIIKTTLDNRGQKLRQGEMYKPSELGFSYARYLVSIGRAQWFRQSPKAKKTTALGGMMKTPEGFAPINKTTKPLDQMTRTELITFAKKEGIAIPHNARKAEILELCKSKSKK